MRGYLRYTANNFFNTIQVLFSKGSNYFVALSHVVSVENG